MTYVGKKPADIIATAVDTTTGTFSGDLTVDTNTLYVDSANNRVGVGTTSPELELHIKGSGNQSLRLETTDSTYIGFDIQQNSDGSGQILLRDSKPLIFYTNSSEAMRIDSSGNLLVGTTNVSPANGNVVGIAIKSNGLIQASSDSNNQLTVNRKTNDGDMIIFKKDGTTAGSIGTEAGDLYIGTDDTGIEFVNGVNAIVPVNATSGADRDNAIDLGVGSIRFKDLYLSGEIDITGSSGAQITVTDNSPGTVSLYMGAGNSSVSIGSTTSDPLTFLTANSERMRIDSSGNLLVGTTDSNLTDNTTGSGVVAQANGALVVARQANTPFYVNRTGTSDGTLVDFRKDGGTVGSIGVINSDRLYIGTPDGSQCAIRFDGDTQDILPSNASGSALDNAISLGDGGTRFKDLYLSGGAYIGGTGSANYLDDYEEGTWTPTLASDSTNPTVTYTANRSGSYIKVGDVVHVMGRVNTSSVSGGTGNARIGGLPFATGAERNAGAVGYISSVTNSSGYTTTGLNPIASASSMRIVQSGSGLGGATVAIGNIGNNFDVTFSHTYKV